VNLNFGVKEGGGVCWGVDAVEPPELANRRNCWVTLHAKNARPINAEEKKLRPSSPCSTALPSRPANHDAKVSLGICKLSNLIHWMTIYSPLMVKQAVSSRAVDRSEVNDLIKGNRFIFMLRE